MARRCKTRMSPKDTRNHTTKPVLRSIGGDWQPPEPPNALAWPPPTERRRGGEPPPGSLVLSPARRLLIFPQLL